MCIKQVFAQTELKVRQRRNFCNDWKFYLGDIKGGELPVFNDASWRKLKLPNDWSIEGPFSKDNPATPGGGALPGGIGWYRKSFSLSADEKDKRFFIEFDGVYRNSEVWINGHYLGLRPYGYSSFSYELTPFLSFGEDQNVISVKVDNSKQPNSRWYSGSGIYRNVWLLTTDKTAITHWGTFVTASEATGQSAKISMHTKIENGDTFIQKLNVRTTIIDASGKTVGHGESPIEISALEINEVTQQVLLENPSLWSFENPHLYRVVSAIEADGKDLFFITAKVVDKDGLIVPTAENLIKFEISGPADIIGTDNGYQTDHNILTSPNRKAFSGKCLTVVKAGEIPGQIILKAVSDNIEDSFTKLNTVK